MGNGAVADAPVEPAPGQMIQHGDTVGHFHRIVDRQQGYAGRQLDLAGQGQGFGDEQVGAGGVFPPLGDMLANPGFVIAQPVGGHQQVQIPVIGIGIGTVRRMQRHHKQSELHKETPLGRMGRAGVLPGVNRPAGQSSG